MEVEFDLFRFLHPWLCSVRQCLLTCVFKTCAGDLPEGCCWGHPAGFFQLVFASSFFKPDSSRKKSLPTFRFCGMIEELRVSDISSVRNLILLSLRRWACVRAVLSGRRALLFLLSSFLFKINLFNFDCNVDSWNIFSNQHSVPNFSLFGKGGWELFCWLKRLAHFFES